MIPPLKAIRYFEIAAEHESFSKAAQELRVSKGAISQQVKHLEQYLGVSLFRRNGRRLALTDAGRRYHSASRNALNILERETERIAGTRVRGQLRITVLPAFASTWLVPRLSEFRASKPHIEIVVSADAEMVDFSRSDAQLGIRYGESDTDGLTVTPLGYDILTPVCAPEYAKTKMIDKPDDLSDCLLLHDTYWSDDWPHWLSKTGAANRVGGDGQYFTHYGLAIETARTGGGIAMGHRRLLRDLIERNELVCPFPQAVATAHEYHVVIPNNAAHLEYVRSFRDWLMRSFR